MARISSCSNGRKAAAATVLLLALSSTASAAESAAAAAAGGGGGEILDPAVAKLLLNVLGPVLSSFNLLFVARIVMSWYPNKVSVGKFPFVIAYAPTEPLLAPTRRLIPPIGGVDMAPVAWVAIVSLANEVLLGPQGLLVLLSQQQQ